MTRLLEETGVRSYRRRRVPHAGAGASRPARRWTSAVRWRRRRRSTARCSRRTAPAPAPRSGARTATRATCCSSGSRTSSAAARSSMRSRSSSVPRHPVLDHALVRQGGALAPVRVVAPGQQLLGRRDRRPRERLARDLGVDGRERLRAPPAREPRRPHRWSTSTPGPRTTCSPAGRPSRTSTNRSPSTWSSPPARRRCSTTGSPTPRTPTAAPTAASASAGAALHRLAHASHPNRSADRRIGIGLRYIPPSARQVRHEWDSATLVRGEDRYGHFELEPVPTRDFDPPAVEMYRRTDEAQRAVYYRGAAVEGAAG